MASWHGADLNGVLNELREEAERLRTQCPAGISPPFYPGGHIEEQIAHEETRHRRPVPSEIWKLYSVVQGLPHHEEGKEPPSTFILPPSDTGWPHPNDRDEIDPEWQKQNLFCFARTHALDHIAYCTDPGHRYDGFIVLIESECQNKLPSRVRDNWYTPIVFLADTLAEWLARWMALEYTEFATVIPGKWPVGRSLERDFLEDHIRLNPGVEWAKRRLGWMDKEDTPPPGSQAALIPCHDCGKRLYLGTILDFDSRYHKEHKYVYGSCPACDGSIRLRFESDACVLGADGNTSTFEAIGTFDQPGLRATKRWGGPYEIVLDRFRWSFNDFDQASKQPI